MDYIDKILSLSFHSLACAIITYVYVFILSREDILNWWFRFGERFNGRWFYKPVWDCEKCISGQMALWSYPAICLNGHTEYFCFLHIYTVCLSILLSIVITKILKQNKIG
jgi:hypothetical protein